RDGPVRTLVVKLPPIFQGRPFSQFYLFGQARCAVNHRAVSAWSEHFALQILPAPVEKYVPRPEQINFRSVTVRGRTSVYLTINFPDSGFTVLDWGTPSRDGNKFVVNTEIVHWQGITLPVISPETHRYKFGLLASGEYTFEFRAWDEPVVVYRFRVSCLPVDLNQDGQCDIADITLLGRIILGLPVLADNVFNSSYPSWLLEASDINGDGAVDITDLIQVITAIK
ncbi:MAG TPA: dockerin type I domain-containing protein, partial [bacterium]|nr:dockerin type I domain-containing protein [bacterium]